MIDGGGEQINRFRVVEGVKYNSPFLNPLPLKLNRTSVVKHFPYTNGIYLLWWKVTFIFGKFNNVFIEKIWEPIGENDNPSYHLTTPHLKKIKNGCRPKQ